MVEKGYLMYTWVLSLSGEIGTKQRATYQLFQKLVFQGLFSRLKSCGLDCSFEEKNHRFLLSSPQDLTPLLCSQFGVAKLARLFRTTLDGHEATACPWDEVLPLRPFTYTVYVEGIYQRGLWTKALNIKRQLLSFLRLKAQEHLSFWDNHPPYHLDIRLILPSPEECWLLINPMRGPSGLPIGAGGKVLCLFSGGPDSLLAAYLLGRRGQEVELIFFDDQEPYRQEAVRQGARKLAYFFPHQEIVLWQVPYAEALRYLAQRAPKRDLCFLCKGLMFVLATDLARQNCSQALASGEILGEQASQTISALPFYKSPLPILRPVITFNKDEIFAKLKEIGLEKEAHRGLPPCSFVPKHPRTKPKITPERAQSLIDQAKRLCPLPQKMVLSWGRRCLWK